MPSWIIVLIVLIAAVAGIIYSLIRDKKQGKSSCGHNCSSCGGACHCHGSKAPLKK